MQRNFGGGVIMAKSRRSLSDTLGEELTPEMEAFRRGSTSIQEKPLPLITPEELPLSIEVNEAPASKGKNRKLVVELDPDLYDAFATACFQKKIKMAKLVREWVEDYTKVN